MTAGRGVLRGAWRRHAGLLCAAALWVLVGVVVAAAPAEAPPAAQGAHPDDAELASVPDEDWLHYNRTYSGERYSPLAVINAANAAQLTPRCLLQLGDLGSFEASPIVYAGRMYVTTPHKTIAADAATCALLWSHTYVPAGPEHIPASRGVALYRGVVYRGTTDAHLLALSADSGKVLWDVTVADAADGYFISAAPLAFNGRIYIGEAGAEFGIKGHIHAFDAATGRELWRFNVIPEGDEPGADSWSAGREQGGGSSWSSMALDVAGRQLFVPTGNPGPDFNSQGRRGANLYTDSVVVLDLDTGRLRWHVQQVPGDYHDWDTAAAPAIYEQDGRPYMAVASKDGFLYLYARDSHALIARAGTMARVNVEAPFSLTAPVRYCPGGLGQWNGPAYSPREKLLFVGTAERCDTIQMVEPRLVRGESYSGGVIKPAADEHASGSILGLDAASGAQRWIYHSPSVILGGVTATAGGLLLAGDGAGQFLVLAARTGAVLYRFQTGGGIAAGISTYSAGGEQLIAVPSGNSSRAIWGTTGSATVLVFGLAR